MKQNEMHSPKSSQHDVTKHCDSWLPQINSFFCARFSCTIDSWWSCLFVAMVCFACVWPFIFISHMLEILKQKLLAQWRPGVNRCGLCWLGIFYSLNCKHKSPSSWNLFYPLGTVYVNNNDWFSSREECHKKGTHCYHKMHTLLAIHQVVNLKWRVVEI